MVSSRPGLLDCASRFDTVAAFARRWRFVPRVEQLEARLPPGAVLDWLAPLLASTGLVNDPFVLGASFTSPPPATGHRAKPGIEEHTGRYAGALGSTLVVAGFTAQPDAVLAVAAEGTADLARQLNVAAQGAIVTAPFTLPGGGWRPPTTRAAGAITFAVIGDFGSYGYPEYWVSEMVKSWGVNFVITTGDNNYPNGAAGTIVPNIGWFYCDYIHNPTAPWYQRCNSGLEENLFFPSLGNHDWNTTSGGMPRPYQDYFTLPGNERYYDFVRGPVHFFALDSDTHEPHGTTFNSIQGQWFSEQIAASEAPWKLVYMHHPPYSSGDHGSTLRMQWPYQELGVSAVLAGHDHTYERIVRDGFPYFVNGIGGNPGLYRFGTPLEGSEVRYNRSWGAQYVEATADSLSFYTVNIQGELIDSYFLGG